jgi:hypothetical protein
LPRIFQRAENPLSPDSGLFVSDVEIPVYAKTRYFLLR